jgi:hypothetical protein
MGLTRGTPSPWLRTQRLCRDSGVSSKPALGKLRRVRSIPEDLPESSCRRGAAGGMSRQARRVAAATGRCGGSGRMPVLDSEDAAFEVGEVNWFCPEHAHPIPGTNCSFRNQFGAGRNLLGRLDIGSAQGSGIIQRFQNRWSCLFRRGLSCVFFDEGSDPAQPGRNPDAQGEGEAAANNPSHAELFEALAAGVPRVSGLAARATGRQRRRLGRTGALGRRGPQLLAATASHHDSRAHPEAGRRASVHVAGDCRFDSRHILLSPCGPSSQMIRGVAPAKYPPQLFLAATAVFELR